MKKINCLLPIPELEDTDQFEKNAWISPKGEFYGFDGANHLKAAAFIAIFQLGADDKTLKTGTFFNESWEDWLLKQGWCSIKNLEWLGSARPSTFRYNELTEKQKTVLFDYCEFFGYNWEEIIGEE
jgi:hypothetical protein